MKKTKKTNKIADAILTADLHLTARTPISRTDNYIKAQENKLKFLRELSEEHNNCPVICAGDVFDHWKASPWLCSWAHSHLPRNLITVPGNHDLPMHSINEYDKSALHLLENVGQRIIVLNKEIILTKNLEIAGVSFGQIDNCIFSINENIKERRILILHELIWPKNKPKWASNSYTAADILERYGNQFDLIVTGDNHQSFVVEGDNSILVNPGSMMRMNADQMDVEPKCYLYYADDNSVEPIKFPIEKNVHRTDHLVGKKERDERIDAYINQISNSWEGGLSFKDNLEAFFKENNTPRKVREIIWQHLETGLI